MSPIDPDRPQPVLDAAKLGGLVSAAVTTVGGAVFLIAAGVTSDSVGAVGTAVGLAVTALVALVVYVVSGVQGRKASAKVTPLTDPQDDRGVALVPVDEYGEHAALPGDDRPSPSDFVDRRDLS